MYELPVTFIKGRGSGLIQYGSGSSILAQSVTGYANSLNPNPMRIRIQIHNRPFWYKIAKKCTKCSFDFIFQNGFTILLSCLDFSFYSLHCSGNAPVWIVSPENKIHRVPVKYRNFNHKGMLFYLPEIQRQGCWAVWTSYSHSPTFARKPWTLK
jgi:hypothetical protein